MDTARSYNAGKQEAFTREAGWKQRNLTLATKLFPDPTNTTPEEHAKDIRQQFETSLKELGTEGVDILYLRAPSRDVPFSVTLRAINELYQEGKFRHFGLSNYASFEVAEIMMLCHHNGWAKPSVYQGTHNALVLPIDSELLPCLRPYGISFYAYSPLAGGLLTDRYMKSNNTLTEGRFSEASGKLGKGYREMWYRDRNLMALRPVYELARRERISMLQVALRWMVHHSPLNVQNNKAGAVSDVVVIGASSKEQLEESLDVLEQGPLSEEVLRRLDEAWKMVKAEADPYWAGQLVYGPNNQEALISKP